MTRQPHEPRCGTLHRDPRPTVSIRTTVAIARLAEAQGEGFAELWKYTQESGVPVAGRPVSAGRVAAAELPSATWHLGSHDSLGETYALLEEWLKENDHEPAGGACPSMTCAPEGR